MAEGIDPYVVSTAVLSGIIIAVVLAFLVRNRSGLSYIGTGGVREFSYIMMLFLPHVLTAFGFIADALSQDFRYSIPSIVGISSIFANHGIGKLIRYALPTAPFVGTLPEGCFIPGFESFVSEFSSAPMVVTFTVMSYYVIDLLQNRGFMKSIAALISMGAFIASQYFILSANGCLAGGIGPLGILGVSSMTGLLLGGSAYGIVRALAPGRLPSVVYSREKTDAPVTTASTRKSEGCSGGNCGAPSDDDQFVCDSYVNGQPV